MAVGHAEARQGSWLSWRRSAVKEVLEGVPSDEQKEVKKAPARKRKPAAAAGKTKKVTF